MKTAWTKSIAAAAALAALACMLGLWQSSAAAQRTGGEPPFANAVEQRQESNALLREIRDLLKEQNTLLRSGKVQVVVSLPEKR